MVSERARTQEKLTKRFVLSLVASIYDPLGFLTPFTLRGRRLIQKMWSENLEWEQVVSEESSSELRQWAFETENFSRFQIPRHYPNRLRTPIAYNLHIFGDASPMPALHTSNTATRTGSRGSRLSSASPNLLQGSLSRCRDSS